MEYNERVICDMAATLASGGPTGDGSYRDFARSAIRLYEIVMRELDARAPKPLPIQTHVVAQPAPVPTQPEPTPAPVPSSDGGGVTVTRDLSPSPGA